MAPVELDPSHITRTLSVINKGGRGDALNAKLNDHIRKKNEKPTITIKPGIIVRKFAPWSTTPNGSQLENQISKKFYDLILEKFTIDLHVVRMRKAVNTMLANEYRQFRCTLHKHYLQYKQDGTERENPHHRVKKVEKRIQPFIDGSKPFARYREEMCDPETGEVVEQIEFYKLTHCKNDVWTCHTAEENYGKMLELRAAPTPEGSTPLIDAQICEEVLGVRSGYVKGLGHGYEKPSSSSLEYNAELGEALRRANEQNRTIQGLVIDTMDIRRMLLEMRGNRESIPENRQSTPENHQSTSGEDC
ncbi:hypothetical protein MKW92_015949 [Papaver armeniacum]|nr:hypothetical protein MKW92_015949 [Papaver armeniacum]